MKNIVVKNSAIEKLKHFHPWIYKDEIKKLPKNVKKGELVKVISPFGEFLGIGYINLDSVITVRILTFDKSEIINREFFFKRILTAFKYKSQIFNNITNAYRVIHSEGDNLAGLIVDKYGDFLSIQFNTAGINRYRDYILSSLIDIFKPKGIFEKVDEKVVNIESLKNKEQTIYGSVPEEVEIYENSLKFIVSIKKGQKTGFFLDQRKNRKVVSSYVKEGFKILDLFSNSGGFGIYALKNKAKLVEFVDISKEAVNQIEKNCKINGFENFKVFNEDAFDFLNSLNRKYNLIVIDPPPFAKTKKEKNGAIKGFQYLVINSIKSLEEEGLIAVFSCSHHITEEDLKKVLLFASSKTKRRILILEKLMQDLDHTYLLNSPSSFYLKGFLVKVI